MTQTIRGFTNGDTTLDAISRVPGIMIHDDGVDADSLLYFPESEYEPDMDGYSCAINNDELVCQQCRMGSVTAPAMEIIKTIGAARYIVLVMQDIAFQTNVQALDATIKAAQAGEYEMGFEAITERIRSHAAKSQKAARDATDIIEALLERFKMHFGTGDVERAGGHA
jgi:hypothetical protein